MHINVQLLPHHSPVSYIIQMPSLIHLDLHIIIIIIHHLPAWHHHHPPQSLRLLLPCFFFLLLSHQSDTSHAHEWRTIHLLYLYLLQSEPVGVFCVMMYDDREEGGKEVWLTCPGTATIASAMDGIDSAQALSLCVHTYIQTNDDGWWMMTDGVIDKWCLKLTFLELN